MHSIPKYSNLYEHWTYTTRPELLELDDRVKLAYDRAKAITLAWNLSHKDIATCSNRFWDFQRDPILLLDIGCNNILACHINLFLGTIIPMLSKRPDLLPIVERGLKCEYFGNMLLSEVGHGLNIVGIETTATKVEDGFVLNTPHPNAAKFMPPTTPIRGYGKMAIVFANLIVDGENRGTHPFLVTTSTAQGMCKGVQSKRLPPRTGSSPLDFAITSFDHVHLPPSSFLGKSMEKPKDRKELLHSYIWRIPVGSLAISITSSLAPKFIATIGSDYSYRRHVIGNDGKPIPIIDFRTQQLPILYSTAVAYVLHAWLPHAIAHFMDPKTDPRARHGVAVVFKATVLRLTNMLCPAVAERLGAQGTFGHNLISQMEMDNRGISIAEGDILVLCIRLFSELLLGRYTLPTPTHPDTLLARHAAGILSEGTQLLSTLAGGHRDAAFNDLLLPQAERGVTALGHALAHSFARDAGVPAPLLDLYECFVVQQDAAWYCDHAGLTGVALRAREDDAVRAALPHLRAYIDTLDCRRWIAAPIMTDESWGAWLGLLPVFTGGEPQDETLLAGRARL